MNGMRGEVGFESRQEQESRLFSETERLLAQYIETGASWDPQKLAQVRAQLHQNFKSMGVLDSSGQLDPHAYNDFACKLARAKDTPIKPADFPEEAVFEQKYKEILIEQPEFAEIQGRGNHQAGEYLYGVGVLMANRPVYEAVFENDPIVIRNGQVENGRHRSLARDILGRCGYNTSGWSWVKTETEK